MMITSDDYYLTLEAIASCALEGSELAIELMKLKETDYPAFLRRLVDEEWIGKERG